MMRQALVFHPAAMNETVLVHLAKPGLAAQFLVG
jgi:hypothetical protein